MDGSIDAFAADLGHCDSLEAVGALFYAAVGRHGYTVSAAGAFVPTLRGPETRFFFQNWPADWIALYRARNFVAADFSVAEARRRVAPFTWLEARAGRTLSPAEREVWSIANEWGWEDGFSVPIHGPGGYFGLVNMGGRKRDLSPTLRAELHALSLMTHERCRELLRTALFRPEEAALTMRELECLRWVASGKTDREIGTILGVSAATVKTHVDQARAKFGARTRPQAVARMVLAGLS